MSGAVAGISPVPQSLVGNSVAVGVVALAHILIATYLTGSATLAVIAESTAMVRDDARYERVAHGIVRSWAYVFAFGSALAIFWVLFIFLGLWGAFFTALTQITFWMLVFEAGAFVGEVALIYTLYHNWDALYAHRRARLAMVVLLNIDMWWQMFFIDVVASYMLTPNGGDRSQLNLVLNPTDLPLTLHRTVGNIAWAGAVLAFVAGLRHLRATRVERRAAQARLSARSVGAMAEQHLALRAAGQTAARDRRFYDWLGQWGMLWAVAMTLFQPWVGYSYAKEVQLHSYSAWFRMMFEDLSNVFLTQIFLLGMIFVLGALYMWWRLRASGAPGARTMRAVVVLLCVTVAFTTQPAWFALSHDDVVAAHLDRPWWDGGLLNPLGNFIPYKVAGLVAMMLLGITAVTVYLRALSRDQLRWGEATRGAQRVLMALGVTVTLMMIVMGVIREHSRQPFLIHGELRIQQQQVVRQPGLSAPAGSTHP